MTRVWEAVAVAVHPQFEAALLLAVAARQPLWSVCQWCWGSMPVRRLPPESVLALLRCLHAARLPHPLVGPPILDDGLGSNQGCLLDLIR